MNVSEDTVELQNEVLENEIKALWVFAYGSLCWKPGFKFHKAVTGHVKGYQRRFWQGNTTHRGTEEKPGRVATLVEDYKGVVHGIAFAISGEEAISYLSKRECLLGGYISQFSTFYPIKGEPFKVLAYVATPKNPLWMGEADDRDIAHQIIDCSGPSGHNIEYLVRLANFMREHFSDEHDPHLFSLEKEVLDLVNKNNMCLETLMGNGEGCVSFIRKDLFESESQAVQDEDRIESFEHSTRMEEKILRCLNI
ncbi:glutathione-specific gamma-glutamylcyclotransferase 1 [Anoplophora glabripennis]|uniref:glutathione-specific gamma-glutamylcyclotransferase 1 n=1 Tax=Anoplophora glabripennis TaxID=217634 RepID=UPI0008745C38|nr:glutathione-specific gamma-glutamylcyclotransferase 1 [Anoplophora glabripennis]